MDIDIVRKLPKVELHCHLDGSVSVECLEGLICSSGDDLPEDWPDCTRAPKICNNLAEYLRPFPLVVKYLQTVKSLELAAYDVAAQASAENIIYLELRFAPMLHCQDKLKGSEAVQAVLAGLLRAEQDFKIKTGLILCLMRGNSDVNNKAVVDTAPRYRNDGVIAIDLAGNEIKYPPEQYAGLFAVAKSDGTPFTIHAGENGPAENVLAAIQMGASRIGHGLALAQSPELCRICVQKKILLELCPTSNLQTKAAKSLQDYPINFFIRSGVRVSVNTDNRTVSNTDLAREYILLEEIGMDYGLMKQININAIEHAYLPETEKQGLAKIIQEAYSDHTEN